MAFTQLSVALALLSLFSPMGAGAFTLNSTSDPNIQGWATKEVTLLVNSSNCPASVDVEAMITEAITVWNNVPTSNVKVSYGGTTTSTSVASPTTVYCETNFQGVTNADQNAVPGAAAVAPPPAGGNIAGGLLVLNVSSGTGNIANFDRTKLVIIVAHEIGHILGLGHSHDTNALMYYDASAKTTFSLSQDDIDGISYLYPRNEIGSDKPMGCALVAPTGGSVPPSGGAALLLILSLPLAALWSLRKKSNLRPV